MRPGTLFLLPLTHPSSLRFRANTIEAPAGCSAVKAPLLAILLVVLAGCTQPADGADVDIRHVHGLAHDPDRGLFVATHHGLARGAGDGGDWSWSFVGSDRHDYMGFTQDAERPGVFYSSGHPDHPANYGAVHLGLRRSLDGGESWEQRSLKGEVDFHALTSIPGAEGWLAGFWQGDVKVSRDGGATWSDHPGPGAPVTALAGAPGRLLAGTTVGLFETRDLDVFDWRPVEAGGLPPLVASLAAGPDGETLLATAAEGGAGSTYRSLDGGATWTRLTPDALREVREVRAPVLFAVGPEDPSHVFASTSQGHILESRDSGATWETIREA